jgi:hypothetical protein
MRKILNVPDTKCTRAHSLKSSKYWFHVLIEPMRWLFRFFVCVLAGKEHPPRRMRGALYEARNPPPHWPRPNGARYDGNLFPASPPCMVRFLYLLTYLFHLWFICVFIYDLKHRLLCTAQRGAEAHYFWEVSAIVAYTSCIHEMY